MTVVHAKEVEAFRENDSTFYPEHRNALARVTSSILSTDYGPTCLKEVK